MLSWEIILESGILYQGVESFNWRIRMWALCKIRMMVVFS